MKKNFFVLCLRFSVGDVTSGGVLAFFGHLHPALGANLMNHFLAKFLLETRQKSTTSEPLIDILAYLQPKLWAKKQNLKISAPTNPNLGWLTPIFYMAITRQQLELESCSNPLKTREVLTEKNKLYSVGCRPFWPCLHNHRMFWQACQNIGWRHHPVGVQQPSTKLYWI